jgi:CRISPR-associated protein Cas1
MTSPGARPPEIPDLWQQVTSRDALHEGWHRVLANDGGAGGDGVGPGDFKADLFANLTQLRAELLGGTYRTGPFRKVSIPKKKPGYRILTIPSIRDRVLHTSIANALTPVFEPLFEDGSFAYRPDRGVVHAVARIESWRQRGYTVVIEADIVSYFDNIDHAILLQKVVPVLTPRPGSAALLALIGQILADVVRRAILTP